MKIPIKIIYKDDIFPTQDIVQNAVASLVEFLKDYPKIGANQTQYDYFVLGTDPYKGAIKVPYRWYYLAYKRNLGGAIYLIIAYTELENKQLDKAEEIMWGTESRHLVFIEDVVHGEENFPS